MAASRNGFEAVEAEGSAGCRGSSGMEVVLPLDPAVPAPLCPHGPTLLFVKVTQGKEETRRFYACSACRDRKDCNFFQWEDEKLSGARLAAREAHNRRCQPPLSRTQCVERYLKFIELPLTQRKFCQTCQQLLLPDDWGQHSEHQVLGNVSITQLRRPSQLLYPLENKKTNAQYLFADRSCQFLVDLLSALGFRRVLCVGTPRLHELIKLTASGDKKSNIKSLLLDIDFRYSQFYMEDSFCHYNMFNHHFFDGKVDYDNHALYKHGKTGRKQSPVRIFTNIPPNKIILPTEEGYRFCSPCQRYVSLENQHCELCNSCTSKDGRKWNHCFLCKKCVKPSWIHCSICNHCAVPDHSCEGPKHGCFICGELDHKRSTCPNIATSKRANKAVRKQKQRKSNKMKMETTKGQSMNHTSATRRKKRRERAHQYLGS
ncbi:rRNA N(6)-adenosine-methyltransferase ZCCHC4 isoform X2 [Homo sapiens]|uniref:rRNA N(6)-adenosine-methyltransferase ZCCHC4 isoform X2 n=1 Tax=Homo sapiens TaxID=9606 RepID=UPI0007DC7BB3|nr:rRNA N6-adenosine-methyltransferase ZCCHC4 isoform X2 [Homo sapiens]|eukprot:XP_016863618.1 zinc finger CCHC domain-containing protein 4 isoform X3 [Homo sapiens]